ncbi:MAG: hypothetical protein RIQ89_714 [Bacteroidota bacterium]|jgi:8-oxo-dGTP pyrophosphatase MutT (NUDIX family)
MSYPFNVRVYGIYIQHGKLLLTQEVIRGKKYIKFPGGGLQFGEGIKECLAREMMEESGENFHIHSHYYTTEKFIPSAFASNEQIISIYFLMEAKNSSAFEQLPHTINELTEESFQFFWIPINTLNPQILTLPIDRTVAENLLRTNAIVTS